MVSKVAFPCQIAVGDVGMMTGIGSNALRCINVGAYNLPKDASKKHRKKSRVRNDLSLIHI